MAAKPTSDQESAPLTDRHTLAISRAIADPRRFRLLQRIAQGEARCANLRECLDVTAATLSHHMKELESAGLIDLSKEGKFVQATLRRKTWKAYLKTLKSL